MAGRAAAFCCGVCGGRDEEDARMVKLTRTAVWWRGKRERERQIVVVSPPKDEILNVVKLRRHLTCNNALIFG